MKSMIIKLNLVLLTCFASINIFAQNITLKSVSLNTRDLGASTNPRKDTSGKSCAIIKVDVIGVKDLNFIDAIGDVDYKYGEYIVYVPEGIKELKYKNLSGSISGVINFDEHGLEVEEKCVYNVVFESENHIRAAKFSIQPQNAKLTFDGEVISLDENGLVSIERPIGKYKYSIEANGYESQSGTVELIEEDLFKTSIVNLRQKMYSLKITCPNSEASLFVDNTPYGKLTEISDLKVPEGEHVVRLTAPGFVDYEQRVHVDGEALDIYASLEQMKERIVKHKEERTRTSVNIRNAGYTFLGGELFNKEKYVGHDWGVKADISFMQHFAAIFAAREGIAGGVMHRNEDWMKEKYGEDVENVKVSWYLELPLQFGVSFPFAKYNSCLFSLLGGGYGKVMFTNYESNTGYTFNETFWDFGLRFTAQLDIKKFVLGGDFNTSLKGRGLYYGVKIGFKMYLKRTKNNPYE